MGFLGDPKQGATLVDLKAMLGRARLLNREARGIFHQTASLGPEAIIC